MHNNNLHSYSRLQRLRVGSSAWESTRLKTVVSGVQIPAGSSETEGPERSSTTRRLIRLAALSIVRGDSPSAKPTQHRLYFGGAELFKEDTMDAITGMATAIVDSNLELPAAIALFLIIAMGAQLLLKRSALSVMLGIAASAALMGLLYLY